jgi:DMSO/TMAO reductase YedYZ molybdopterin-dependent catalytic subunit
MAEPIDRRTALAGLMGGGMLLAGCDRIASTSAFDHAVGGARALTFHSQRALIADGRLAREFTPADISTRFHANGSTDPDDAIYRAHVDSGFRHWQLVVDGLVHRPLRLSLAQLARLPQRTQITRHDCVEGWSAIAQWQGVPLGLVLAHAGLMPDARYIVFHCADRLGGDVYYESIDLVDGFHPQTILAHRMNGQPLAVAHGAPLRLRVERQLGYKHAKYVMRIELVAGLDRIGGGRGGYWEDRRNYDWYAGI